jgi:hypothetical protein
MGVGGGSSDMDRGLTTGISSKISILSKIVKNYED